MTPVILSRQQLDQLWEIDRSEIIDTLYRLDNGQLRAYREYYNIQWLGPSRSSGLYSDSRGLLRSRRYFFRLF